MLSDEIQFGAQATAWLEELKTRRRNPVSAATLATYKCHVRKLLPIVGEVTPLAQIHNGFLKELVGKLSGSPKTINEQLMVLKAVVGSARDQQTGAPLFPIRWDARYIDAPPISKQNRPCPTREQIEGAIRHARNHQEQILIAVLCGSGLRISEALAIRVQGKHQ